MAHKLDYAVPRTSGRWTRRLLTPGALLLVISLALLVLSHSIDRGTDESPRLRIRLVLSFCVFCAGALLFVVGLVRVFIARR